MKKVKLLTLAIVAVLISTVALRAQNTYVYPSDTLVDPSYFENSNLLVSWSYDMCPVEVNGSDTVFAPCYRVTFKDHYTASIDLCPASTAQVGGIGLFYGTPRLLDATLFNEMETDGSNIISNQDGTSINYKNLTTSVTTDGGGPNPKYCIEADLYNGTSQTWYQEFMILLGPIQKPGPATNYHLAETIGILVNGMVLEHTPPSSESTQALTGGIIPLDRCGFHPEPTGFGHFHAIPYGINVALDANGISSQYHCTDMPQLSSSGLAGFTFEGIPMYGPYDNGMTSAPNDLDGCNGHTSSTPEFPQGVYHYHASATDIINNPPCYDYYMPLESERFIYGEWTGSGVGTNELTSDEEMIHIYPNPASEQVTFEGSFDRLEVYDEKGVTVLTSTKALNGTFTFDVSKLDPGVYFVSASSDQNYFFDKFIIQ
ncbi:MAG: hypothetical protein Crog4KO_08060 [Crocinitomicaceae bacterium]